MNCDGCGLCCHEQNLLPLSGAEVDGRVLPRAMKAGLLQLLEMEPYRSGDAMCVWFDSATKKCAHYDLRPSTCRNFECGGEDCLRIRMQGGIVD